MAKANWKQTGTTSGGRPVVRGPGGRTGTVDVGSGLGDALGAVVIGILAVVVLLCLVLAFVFVLLPAAIGWATWGMVLGLGDESLTGPYLGVFAWAGWTVLLAIGGGALIGWRNRTGITRPPAVVGGLGGIMLAAAVCMWALALPALRSEAESDAERQADLEAAEVATDGLVPCLYPDGPPLPPPATIDPAATYLDRVTPAVGALTPSCPAISGTRYGRSVSFGWDERVEVGIPFGTTTFAATAAVPDDAPPGTAFGLQVFVDAGLVADHAVTGSAAVELSLPVTGGTTLTFVSIQQSEAGREHLTLGSARFVPSSDVGTPPTLAEPREVTLLADIEPADGWASPAEVSVNGSISQGLTLGADSGVSYPLGTRFATFGAAVGLTDDSSGPPLRWQVLADDAVVAEGTAVIGQSTTVTAPITGARILTLRVLDAETGGSSVGFADPRLLPEGVVYTPSSTPKVAAGVGLLSDLAPVEGSASTGTATVGGVPTSPAVSLGGWDGEPTRVAYDLGRGVGTLQTTIGLGDESEGSANWRILGDDRVLAQGTATFEPGVPTTVDTHGVLRLTLEVTSRDGTSSLVVFANPTLLP